MDRKRRVIDVRNVAVAVGVSGVEQRKLLHPHGRFPFLEIVGKPHLPELLEEARSIDRHDAHRDRHAVAIRDDRTVNGTTNGDRLIMQCAVLLSNLDHLMRHIELPDLSVEHVSAILERQAIQIRFVGVVGGLRPSQVVGETLPEHREPDPDRAVRGDTRCRELHFEVGVHITPLQMRIAQQHRLP